MLNANFVIQALEAISPLEREEVQKYLNFCQPPVLKSSQKEPLLAKHATGTLIRKLIVAQRNIKYAPSTQVPN